MAPDWPALRRQFQTLERWIYLDVARKTPAPRCQERALLAQAAPGLKGCDAIMLAHFSTARAREAVARAERLAAEGD